MDYQDLKHILTADIEELTNLRDKLSETGSMLDASEKELLRNQISGTWLSRIFAEQKFFFSQGNIQDLERNQLSIVRMSELLS